MTRPIRLLLAALVALALLGAGCGDDDGDAGAGDGTTTTTTAEDATSSSTPGDDPTTGELSGQITVSAAASLTDAYTEIGEDFEAAHPGTTVTFTFDSSGTLAEQIRQGAPVDVFASADEATMAELTDEDLVAGEPTVFARNELAIVTRPGNPYAIDELDDLVDVGVVSLCSEQAPCGRFAAEILEEAGVEIPEGSVTRGQNVKATLTAVTEGDAVAAIVYVTDARAAGDAAESVVIPADQNAIAVYPIAVLQDAGDDEVARAFADHVRSDDGQAVLEEYGFLPPE